MIAGDPVPRPLLVDLERAEELKEFPFQIPMRIVGFASHTASQGDQVLVIEREILGPAEPAKLAERLDAVHDAIFTHIPGLPQWIPNILAIIRPNLSCTAYVGSFPITAKVHVDRDIASDSPVYERDLRRIESAEIQGISVPDDAGVIIVISHRWRRSLYYDFSALNREESKRQVPLSIAVGRAIQLLYLPVGTAVPVTTHLDNLRDGLTKLHELLSQNIADEAEYQRLFQDHPLLLCGIEHSHLEGHRAFDDKNIPDFTLVRTDQLRDILEIKQPFLPLFKSGNNFAAGFNDAWNQCERYLSFARDQRHYLADKKIPLSDPKCILVVGYDLTSSQINMIRTKVSHSPRISVRTYDDIITQGERLEVLLTSASAPLTDLGEIDR